MSNFNYGLLKYFFYYSLCYSTANVFLQQPHLVIRIQAVHQIQDHRVVH